MKKTNKKVIQNHHIIYEGEKGPAQEEIVRIFKGEHMILTKMQWRKEFSKGFIKSLKVWLALNEDRGVDPDDGIL